MTADQSGAESGLPEWLRGEVQDSRLSPEFFKKLALYMGDYSAAAPEHQSMYSTWFRDHAGGRTQWFAKDLVWRMETSRPLAGRRLLDFGCGTGSSGVVFAERGAEVVGVDTEQVSLDIAVQRAQDWGLAQRCTFQKIPYLNATCTTLPFPSQSFDVVTLIGVLEHMLPEERVLCAAEAERLLRPGGEVFIFDTPNRAHPFDHHTTRLWWINWMPEPLGRRYAVRRGRLSANDDYRRRGGNGISRRQVDRLFPSTRWRVFYDKTREQVTEEFGWLANQLSFAPAGTPRHARWVPRVRRWSKGFLGLVDWFGGRAAYWTPSHTLGLSKVGTPPGVTPSERP